MSVVESSPPVVAIVVTCNPGPWFEETLDALRRVNPRNNPTAEDIAHLHDVHAQHEAEMGRPDRAAAAKQRADRTRGDTPSG